MKPGVVLELRVADRFAYLQFIGKHAAYGNTVLVKPGLGEHQANFTEESFEELDAMLGHEELMSYTHSEIMMTINSDRADYNLFLSQFGFTEADVLAITQLGTVRSMGLLGLEVRASEIQGSGLFATEKILEGSVIAPAVLAGEKTAAGRFVNHSGTPNAKMVVRDKENVDLIAVREINEEEITTDYGETLRERARLFGVGSS